jgi:hypothetical protein
MLDLHLGVRLEDVTILIWSVILNLISSYSIWYEINRTDICCDHKRLILYQHTPIVLQIWVTTWTFCIWRVGLLYFVVSIWLLSNAVRKRFGLFLNGIAWLRLLLRFHAYYLYYECFYIDNRLDLRRCVEYDFDIW